MQKLIQGYRRFHSHVFPQKRRLYARLANGQSPRYLFITCADSRVNPNEFTSTNPGDMFMERSLGNIVPLPGSGETEAISAVEYAVTALGVEHIIICGHTQCGAMTALLNPGLLAGMPTVAHWLKGAEETARIVAEKYPRLEGEALLDATVRENVLVQLGHLSRQPSVVPKLAEGRLQLHGWVFEVEHGRVIAYDPKAGRFVPLVQAYPPATARADAVTMGASASPGD